MADKPFLFPTPGPVLRRGLNVLAQLGETFTEDDATADLMLDLDNVARRRARARGSTGLPHAYSYYAVRWGWGKGTVTRALAGDAERGVEPWIRERVASWRTFYGTAGDRGGTAGDQKAPVTQPAGHIGDRGGTAGDRGGTGIGQTSDHQNQGVGGARPGGECYESPAVEAYRAVTGDWPAPFHAEAIARRFPPGTLPDALTAWAEHVTTYAVSKTRNADNVPGIIQTFDEHVTRKSVPPSSAGRGARRGPAGSDDLGASAARNAERALAALGLGGGGVG